MTIFTHGNDKGFILFYGIIFLLCISIIVFSILEYEISNYQTLKDNYEFVINKGEKNETY